MQPEAANLSMCESAPQADMAQQGADSKAEAMEATAWLRVSLPHRQTWQTQGQTARQRQCQWLLALVRSERE